MEIFWKHKDMVDIKSYSHNHIDTEIKMENQAKWRLTCFYGYPEGSRRRDSWNLLRFLSYQSTLPWAVIGDFNDILRVNEKKGRRRHPNWLISGFREALVDSGLSDLQMEGHPYTWEKSRGTTRWVEVRLDRVCVNNDWMEMFPSSKVTNLIAPTSDHSTIFLQITVWRQIPRGFRFRFENSWLREEGCGTVVETVWKKNGGNSFTQKLDMCARELRLWGDRLGKNFKEKLDQNRVRMNQYRGRTDAFSVQCYNDSVREYSKLLSQQEDFWRQRAKQHWLKTSDCNSKYFHVYASARKKKNAIRQLKDSL